MENIEQMRTRHSKEIEELRSNCKHKHLSNWMDEWWAPAHSTGRIIKICEVCGIVVKIRSHRKLETGKNKK